MTTLLVIAILTLATGATALALRNLIHSALLLVVSWAGIAAFYLWAGAEFVAFAQLLIYVGAISMVVLFAVLLTRPSRAALPILPASTRRAVAAISVGVAVFSVVATAVVRTDFSSGRDTPPITPALTVRDLGMQLMDAHVAAVLAIGVILTVSLLGAVVLAASDDNTDNPS